MKRSRILTLLIGAVVGVFVAALAILIIRSLQDSDVQIIVAVITAATALMVAGGGALIDQGLNQRREALIQRETSRRMAEEAHRERKVAIYSDFIRLVSDFMQGANESNSRRTPQGQKVLERIEKFQNGIMLWGSPVNQFQSSGNAAHLANASNQLDAGINNAATVISLEQPEPSVRAEDAVGFKSLAREVIESLRKQATAVAGRAEQIESDLRSLEAKSQEQKTAFESLQATLDSKLQELEALFSADQTARATQFDSQAEEIQQQADEKMASISKAADERLDALSKKQSEAERIVGLIGNIGLTGNFKGAASREKKSADRLRMIALACSLGMVGVVLMTLLVSVENGFDPWLAIFRLGAGLTLIVPAAYAARESSRHRTLENRNRRAELELASIDAYLETLPDAKKAEIKAELTNKFFGHTNEEEKPDPDVTSSSLTALLKEAINALGKR